MARSERGKGAFGLENRSGRASGQGRSKASSLIQGRRCCSPPTSFSHGIPIARHAVETPDLGSWTPKGLLAALEDQAGHGPTALATKGGPLKGVVHWATRTAAEGSP
jgi:hypothetical protein